MKNFTNNFKQFTSHLSARWLIMTLMLLVGTSSAWGWNKLVIWKSGGSSSEVEFNNGTAQITLSETADYYFYINDNGNKKGLTSTEIKTSSNCKNMSFSGSADCGLRVASGETGLFTFTINSWNGSTPTVSVQYPSASTYLMGLGDWENGKELPCTISLNAGTYEFKIKKGDTWYGNSGTMTSENSKNWKFDSDNNCQITINESGYYYFYVVWADNLPTVSVTYPCEPSNNNEIRIECVHTDVPYLYAWDTSGNLNGGWPGYTMDGSDNIYYKVFTNTNSTESINIIFSGNELPQTSDIKGLKWGKVYRYTRDGELIYSYCLPPACTTPNFSVELSNATVTKGDENITASIPETPSPAVTWSSSKEEVATIDANGNITAHKGGQTTITATTTGDDGFCENVAKPATLTVKENPTVKITADHNPICSGEEATLTANISNLSVGIIPTVSWYKKGENGVKETGTTYNPTTSGEYYVVVTGDYVNEVSLEEDPLQFTINQKPTLESTLENKATEVEICGSGNATLSVTPGFVSYSWGDGHTKTVNATGKYTVTATDAKSCTSNEVEFDVKVLNPTVELVGDNEQTVCPGANANFEVVLAQGQSVSWKDADGTEISTSNPFTPQIEGEAGTTYTYKVVVSEGSCSSEESTVSATIPTIDLTVGSISGDNEICSGNATTLTLSNMTNGNVVKWLKSTDNNNYSDVSNSTTSLNTGNLTTNTYYKAQVSSTVCPNHIESTEPYLVTVNPLPTIRISGSETAVLYEDVTLTAIATADATVKWYEAGLEKATGLTYVVTSETATSKTVTAKAFLNGCESDEASHPVRFSAEDCGNIGSNNSIIITCDPGTYTGDLYCYIFGATTPKGWSDCKGTKTNGIWKWEFNNINEGDHSLIFHSNSKSNGKDCKTGDLDHKLQRGYQYDYALNGVNSNWCNEPHPTIDPVSGKKLQTITDPAVKTVSVETEPGEGNIIFEGQVVKTGCAETLTYGFAYSTDANADKSTWTKIQCTNVGNTVGTQFSGSKTELEDDTYYVCAYITNSEGTTYGTVTEVSVSTVKTPIRDVTLDYCNEDGEDIDDPNPMCKGAIAYVKLSYVGSKYSDIKWLIEGVETNLVTDEGDGVWSYEIQGDGSLSVELKNDENKDPAWPYSNKLPFTTIPEPIAPTISLDKSTLCSNDDEGATISLANTVVGQTYSLFKEIENGDDTQIGNDIECIEQNKESISFNLKGLDVAGRYYVIAKENVCNRTIGTTSVTLEVVNTTGLSISIEPNTAVVTPWEPVKLKITHTEGYQYNVTGLDGMVYTVNGDTYTVKIPLPEDGTSLDTDGNVIFDNIGYNISATLITGGDNQCIDPATCTITLTPYLEPCTQN